SRLRARHQASARGGGPRQGRRAGSLQGARVADVGQAGLRLPIVAVRVRSEDRRGGTLEGRPRGEGHQGPRLPPGARARSRRPGARGGRAAGHRAARRPAGSGLRGTEEPRLPVRHDGSRGVPLREHEPSRGMMAKGKFHLTFPEHLIREPVIYSLGQRFSLVTNIRRANVEEGHGWVILEMEGTEENLADAVAWLLDQGVEVERLADDEAG